MSLVMQWHHEILRRRRFVILRLTKLLLNLEHKFNAASASDQKKLSVNLNRTEELETGNKRNAKMRYRLRTTQPAQPELSANLRNSQAVCNRLLDMRGPTKSKALRKRSRVTNSIQRELSVCRRLLIIGSRTKGTLGSRAPSMQSNREQTTIMSSHLGKHERRGACAYLG